jgi:hypothetical protein
MADILFQGYVHDDGGVAVNGATVELFARNTTATALESTTTNSSGLWTIARSTQPADDGYDVRISNGASIRFIKYDDQIQLNSIEIASLRVRNPADTFEYDIVPAAITASRQLSLPLLTGTATLATIDHGIKGSDISSASGLVLVAGSDFADVTGTTTVTSIGTRPAGSRFTFQFDAALLLTHNSTTLILKGNTNYTTAAGDVFVFISEGGGNWREESRRQVTGGLDNIVEDTTPQLGGNLDMQARLLVGNGGSTGIAISANGEVSMAAQPAFLAYNSGGDANVTGDGAVTTIDFDTEIYDQGAASPNKDFNADTFTAPITGRYSLKAYLRASGFTTSHTQCELFIITSNRTYRVDTSADYVAAPSTLSFAIAIDADMDAADTARIDFSVAGGSQVIDIDGGATITAAFSGRLVA